jgi:hypothetical protein
VRWKEKDVRAFRDRDWDAFVRAPLGIDSSRSEALADSLYRQVRAANPGWPSHRDRERDLAAHIRLSELFARVFDAQRGRVDPR